jgi:uncharacterized membrane protein
MELSLLLFISALFFVILIINLNLIRRISRLEKIVYRKTSDYAAENNEKKNEVRNIFPATKEEWEAMIGGKVLNLIGAVALIIGIGFFLQYAFENKWITESVRVFSGFAVGLVLIYLGIYFDKKDYIIFSQGLTGAGIAVLYLSVFASFNFYHLIPETAAYLLMSIVTIISFFTALKIDAQPVALLGLAGGLLTPFLLSGWEAQVPLFIYTAAVAAGFLAVAVKKPEWFLLKPSILLSVYLIYFFWYFKGGGEADRLLTSFFLFLYWGLLFSANLFDALKQRLSESYYTFLPIINAVLLSAGLLLLFDYAAAGIILLLPGAVYFLSFIILRRKNISNQTHVKYLLASFLLFALGAEVLTGEYLAYIIISIMAIIFLIICGSEKTLLVRTSVFVFLGVSFFRIIISEGSLALDGSYLIPLFNLRSAAYLILAASIAAAKRFLNPAGEENKSNFFLNAGWSFILFILITSEVINYFNGMPSEGRGNLLHFYISGTWLLYSIILIAAGIWKKSYSLRIIAIFLFGAAILKIFIIDLSFLELNYRIYSFIALGLILLTVSYLYQKYKSRISSEE